MSDFAISESGRDDVQILQLSGYLDAHTAPELERAFERLISRGQTKIVVDFAGLDYISSAGLGVFMAYIEDVREQEGDIKLAAMSEKVYNIFDLLGFPMLYEIYEETDTASERFTAPGERK